jgi:hypothetical protein
LGLVNMLRVVDCVLLVSSVFLLIALYRAANSPLIEQSFYRAVEPVTVDTAGPNSPAWFDGGRSVWSGVLATLCGSRGRQSDRIEPLRGSRFG